MYNGDRMRRRPQSDYGFRCKRLWTTVPLKFPEFEHKFKQAVFTSATPGPYEAEHEELRVKAVVRPPASSTRKSWSAPSPPGRRPVRRDRQGAKRGERILVTTLTKKMAEELTKYYQGLGLKVTYLHSDIDTLERIIILEKLRKGEFDVLVGINLLREASTCRKWPSWPSSTPTRWVPAQRDQPGADHRSRGRNVNDASSCTRPDERRHEGALTATEERRARQITYKPRARITPISACAP